jgi:hypothetical protein
VTFLAGLEQTAKVSVSVPGNDLVEICSKTLRMGEFTGDEDVRDDSFIKLTL